jgi:hypothetical protein
MLDLDGDGAGDGAESLEPRALVEEEELLRRTVRRALKSLRLPALRALLRVVRYAEEGKTPMAVAAEDLIVPYKVEAIFAEAEQLRGRRDQ